MTRPAITTALIDVPAPARAVAREVLASDADFSVVGECDSARDGTARVGALAPQLVLAGAGADRAGGRDIVRRLAQSERRPLIILVATDSSWAVDAYSLGAIDYLVLPVGAGRLKRALARAKNRLTGRGGLATPRARSPEDSLGGATGRLLVRSMDGALTVLLDRDIDYCQSSSKHVLVRAGGADHRLQCSLRELEDRLGPHSFIRIHRSTLVNATRICELQPRAHGDCNLLLEDGRSVKVSRRYRKRLVTALSELHALESDSRR